ncbi:MAG: PilZ domain-containing protein [Gemmataceae bacterium]
MPNTVPFWRRWDWLRWRKAYIAYTPASERRAWVRYSCNLAGFCHPAEGNGQANALAIVRNISLGGMSLVTDRPFASGTLLKVEVTSPTDNKTRSLWVRIIRVMHMPDGKWSLGCAFARPLAEADIHSLRVERLRPKAPDRREWVRFHCDTEVLSNPLDDPAAPPFPFHVVNISPGGIAGQVRRSCMVGNLLRLNMQGSETAGFELLARVVHVQPASEDVLLVGCAFVRELSDEELAYFFFS